MPGVAASLRRLLLTGLLLHAVWELAQLPLYELWYTSGWATVAEAVAHCLLGDLLILASCYAVTAVLGRDWRFYRRLGWRWWLFTLSGVGYTAYSEWVNVYLREAWAYAPAMPLLPGLEIGLSPLLQWLLLSPAVLLAAQRLDRHPQSA